MPHPPPCGGRGGMLNIGTAGEEEPAVGVKFGAAGEAVTAVPAGKSVAAVGDGEAVVKMNLNLVMEQALPVS